MKWEFLGKQEFGYAVSAKKSVDYFARMWRTPVPGGWLVVTLPESNVTQTATCFYPDPNHQWKPSDMPEHAESLRLLRPAPSALSTPEDLLLRLPEDE